MRLTTGLIASGLILASTAAGGPAGAHAQAPTVGDRALAEASLETFGEVDYSWRIRRLDGAETTLEAFRGEVLFVNVWASWCVPCVRELESIERMRHRLVDTEVRFLLVAVEDEEPVRRFIRRYGYDLPFYVEVSRMPSGFGLRGIPTSWVVDRQGRIVLLRHGEAVWDTDEVEAFVRRVALGGS